jgi:putative endonuclease
MFYIYILHSLSANNYYVGFSADPWKRVNDHNQNSTDKYTGKHKNWELKAVFAVSENRAECMSIEKFIKKQKSIALLLN